MMHGLTVPVLVRDIFLFVCCLLFFFGKKLEDTDTLIGVVLLLLSPPWAGWAPY